MVLLEQLADREQQRIRAEQLRRIEGEEMARRIEQLKLEEQKVGTAGAHFHCQSWLCVMCVSITRVSVMQNRRRCFPNTSAIKSGGVQQGP